MRLILLIISVGLIFLRKPFSYLGFGDRYYIIDISFLLVAIILLITSKAWIKKLSLTKLEYLMLALALFSFGNGIYKGFECHATECIKELPILIYPVYWAIALFAFGSISKVKFIESKKWIQWSVMLFPIYWMLITFSGTGEYLKLHSVALWPNNNAFLIAAVTPFLQHIGVLGLSGIIGILLPIIIGLVYEAQRGAILCFVGVALLLIRNKKIFFNAVIVVTLWVTVISFFGGNLSYRYQSGSSDAAKFLIASIPNAKDLENAIHPNSVTVNDNHDARYSSTQDRLNMWVEASIKTFSNPAAVFFGLPLNTKIVDRPWRVPHNGYISAFSRGGLICLLFYFFIFIQSVSIFNKLKNQKSSLVYTALLLSLCIDASTQTVFDSPYSLALVLVLYAMARSDLCRIKEFSES